jgi:hypothetical protein
MRSLRLFSLIALGVLWSGCGDGGSCNPECLGSSQMCCEGTCVFHLTDPQHCGMCGVACAAGMICDNGVCMGGPPPPRDGGMTNMCGTGACTSEQYCCNAICVDRDQPTGVDGRPGNPEDRVSAFHNCGTCGTRCDTTRAISCSVLSGGVAQCACGS